MRLFFYYVTHSLLNTIKKLLKTWVAIFVVLMIFGGLVGGFMGMIISSLDKDSDNTVAVNVIDDEDGTLTVTDDEDEVIYEGKFSFISDTMKKYDLKSEHIVDFAISAIFLLLLATNVINSKSSGKIFLPADVPMLFASPLKPQSVLMFRLTCSLGTSLILSLFMLYQIPNLTINAGLSLWGAVSIVIVYMLILMFSTLIQVALYTLTSKLNSASESVNRILIIVYALIGLGFAAYITFTKQELVPALFGYFGSTSTHWVPFWGWLRGFSYNACIGNYLWSAIYLGLFVVACALVVFFIWKMKADFYEDAMFAAEKRAEAMENAKRSTNGATVIRDKERKGSLDREGFHYGHGANVFFYKAVFNRFRFAKLKIFSTTMIVYILTSILVSYLAKRFVTDLNGFDLFILPAAVLGIMVFYRTIGDPIREDTSREFFLLIPDKNYLKIFYSLLGCLAVTAIDLLVPMVIAAVMLGTNPLTVVVWFLFILSISYFATNVGTFIALSIPGETAKTVKTIVQMMFMYFGLTPAAVAIGVGLMFNQLTLAMVIGLVINCLTGFLVSLLLPLFLGRK